MTGSGLSSKIGAQKIMNNPTAETEIGTKEQLQKSGRVSLSESLGTSRKGVEGAVFSAEVRSESEAVEFVDSRISEVAGENKNKKSEPSTGGGSAVTRDDEEEVLELPEIGKIVIPPKKEVIRQIRMEIKKEIREVEISVKELSKCPTTKAHELSTAVDLLRKLRGFLAELAYRSMEYLKNIWINVSQGRRVSDLLK